MNPLWLLLLLAIFFSTYYASWLKRIKGLVSLTNAPGNKDASANTGITPQIALGINLPLSMARIPSDILLSQSRESYSQQDQQMLIAIHHNLVRAEAFIKELHNTGGTIPNQYATLHLPTFAAEILDAFDPMAKSRNIRFHYTIDLDPGTEFLLFDRLKLEKIILNLLLNAFSYSPTKGSICLQIQTRQIQREQVYLQCTVSDNGPAIASVDLLKPDRWSYRMGNFHTSSLAGASLRLAMEIANSIGGRLNTIQPDSSIGAAFTFSIYCAKAGKNIFSKFELPTIHDNLLPLPLEPIGTLHIIEADFEMAEWLKVCLNGYFKIQIYPSAAAFLPFASQNTSTKQMDIDAILIDLLLPDMDGLELYQNIRQHSLLKNIPVITFSTNCHPSIRDKALYLGVDDYITRPFSVDELRLRTLNAVRRSKWYSGEMLIPFPYAAGKLIPISQHILQTIPINKKPWMSQLLQLIEDNLQDEQMSIPFLAKNMAVSKRQLYRLVKEASGLSPNQLIQEIRLNKALQLLENQSDLSVSAVAYAVGMGNPSYFATAFKKRFQKNPSSIHS